MNFDGTKKKITEGSHNRWELNRKIVYHKIWNPRAWMQQNKLLKVPVYDSLQLIVRARLQQRNSNHKLYSALTFS